MDHRGNPQEELKLDDLPQIDGFCDACEPDEAEPASQVCHTCSFAFCSPHADKHANSTHHPLSPYNSEEAQGNECFLDRDSTVAHDAENDESTASLNVKRGKAPLGLAMAAADGSGDAEKINGSQVHAEAGDRSEGATGSDEVEKSVTVEKLRCKEHGQEGSLYCKLDEKIICVVCAVQGEHCDHEVITLHDAYMWQKNKQGFDLLDCTQQMGKRITNKWTDPEMSSDELEKYVNSQFNELRELVRLEERRTLHLVDLKAAFLTGSAAEKIAEITLETERLQEEMDNITHQLSLLERVEEISPALAAEALSACPGPVHRRLHNVEARPRHPPRVDPMDLQNAGDSDTEPPADHAP